MKSLKFTAMLISVMCFLCSCSGVTSGETVASVGGETVTSGEVLFMMAQNVEAVKQQMGNMTESEKQEYWNTDVDGKKPVDIIKEASVDYLINYAILVNAAKEADISVSDSEVKAKMNSIYSSEDLRKIKNTYGISSDSVKKVIRKQLFQQKYVSRVMEKKGGFEPTEEQLLSQMHENYYKAKHILISTVSEATGEPYTTEQVLAAREKAENILKRIRDGADFDALMTENTEDPGVQSYPDGYVFTEGEMVQEFYDGTVKLPENSVSDIIETSYGFHIIKRLPLSDSDMAGIEAQLINSYKNDYLDSYIEELKEKYEVTQDDAKLNEISVNTEF